MVGQVFFVHFKCSVLTGGLAMPQRKSKTRASVSRCALSGFKLLMHRVRNSAVVGSDDAVVVATACKGVDIFSINSDMSIGFDEYPILVERFL